MDARRGLTGLAAPLGIALVACAVYAGTLDSPFVLDDGHNIEENRLLRLPLSPRSLWRAAFDSPSASRPVANATFALSWQQGSGDVTPFHAANIALHALNGILVWLLARATLRLARGTSGGARGLRAGDVAPAALLAGLLFTVHPVQTQAVTYVVQRMTELATAFYLASLLCYLRGRSSQPGRRRTGFFAAALACWLLALGSKQIAVTLPAVALLYELYFLRDLDLAWLRRQWRWLALAALASAAAALAYLGGDPSRIAQSYAGRGFGVGERVLTQPRVLVFYASLLLLPLPSRQNLLHDFPASRSLFDPWTTLPSLLAVLGLLVFALAIARRERLVSFCLLWWLCNLALESSVIGLEMAFEHRLYLPSVGPALLAGALAFRALPTRAAWAAGAAAVLLLGTAAHARNATWRDRVTLWSDVVRKHPESHRAQNSLGRALEQAGRDEDALLHFREALRLKPDHTEALYNLGVLAYRRGDVAAAIRTFERALAADPAYARAHNNLAAALARSGRSALAEFHFRETLRLEPLHANARFNLGVLLEQRGELAAAAEQYAEALRLSPGDAETARRLAAVRAHPRGDPSALERPPDHLTPRPGDGE